MNPSVFNIRSHQLAFRGKHASKISFKMFVLSRGEQEARSLNVEELTIYNTMTPDCFVNFT